MEEKQFVELVDRLEVYSREHPTAYKFRVGLLAALGYLYLFAVVGGILLLVGAVMFYGKINYLVIKLLWIPVGIAAVVLNSLRIKFPEPEGHELKPEVAPRLFDLVKEVQEAVEGPHVHRVLLTDDFNAGIVQRPRLGILHPTSVRTRSCWRARKSTKPIVAPSNCRERNVRREP